MLKGEDKKINLVHDSNLDELLKNLGILEEFDDNRKKCKFCGTTVDRSNLHSLFKESGDIKLVCDSADCIKELILYLKK